MIKNLKIKILMVIISILFIVFFIVIASINIINYNNNKKMALTYLTDMAEMDGNRPFYNPPPGSTYNTKSPLPEATPGVFHLMQFYGARLDNSQNITAYISENTQLYSDSYIKEIVTEVLKKKKETGSVSQQFFLITEKSYGKLVLFMDNRIYADNTKQLIQISVIIGCISMILLSFLAVILTNWLLKPVQETLLKQKQFISDASHELKTPLTVISANVDVLESEIGDNKWLHYIKTESSRMSKLVNHLLLLAKLDASKSSTILSEFNVGQAIISVLLPFESLAFEQEINFTYEISDHIIFNGDENKFKQLAAILIENAFKYCDPKGTVRAELTRHNSKIVFTVFNTGRWIEPDDLPKVFDRFFRSDKSRDRSHESYGLGLAIAKSIVSQFKGTITVESKKDIGTKFTVSL